MSKARKGLFLSLMTFVIALAITATSTFAWFMVNTSVSAQNMQVRVKSDTTFLVISATNSLSGVTATELTTFTAGDPILPAAYVQSTTPGEETDAGAWKKGRGQGYSTATLQGSYQDISAEDLTAQKYYTKYTFYVGLTNTSALPATNLRVENITAAVHGSSANTFLGAVSAVVNYDDVWLNFVDITSLQAADIAAMADLADTVAINTPMQIDVYLYINGDNTAVTSANALPANLGSFDVNITLGVTPGVEQNNG